MSVNIYARATKLTDVCGRVDYATNPDRQENLKAKASTVDLSYWKKLAKDSQTAFRTAGGAKYVMRNGKMVRVRCCEAREIVVDLPNSAEKEDLKQLAKEIVEDFKRRTGAECLVAIHQNKAEKNLHIHLIYSERELLQEPEIRVAERNAFIDEEGRRRRTKKEILNEDGQLRPGCRIVRKGEVISERYFGEKNPMFKDMGWLYSYKHDMASWINERLDPDEKREVFDKFGPYLAKRHIGPGEREMKEEDLEWNENVNLFNGLVKDGVISEEQAIERKTQIQLAPYKSAELKAVLAEISLESFHDLPEENHEYYEKISTWAGMGERTKEGPNEGKKRKLREAYHQAAVAWKAYRNAVPGSIDQKEFLAKARSASATVDRLKRELGYDRPVTTRERQQAVWDVHAANKAAELESEEVKKRRQKAVDRRGEAWEKYDEQRRAYRAVNGYWTWDLNGERVKVPPLYNVTPGEKKLAELALQQAKDEYQKSRNDIQAFNRAYKLQEEYRRYALQVASDPSFSDKEAERAKEKYMAAMRRLKTPTTSTCNELQKQLSDLKRSQLHRKEKEQQNAAKKDKSLADGGIGESR